MPIETNLNQSPFFDDFSEDKNFHRVLFRPGYAVQARELTQLQTILQNQIERGFNEVLKDGTVVTGVPVRSEQVQYVKLKDRDANNRIILTSDFFNSGVLANATVTGTTSGVEGLLVDVIDGSEAAAADGSGNNFTIYVQYTNSGTDNATQTFSGNEILTVRTRAGAFQVAANTIATDATGKGFRAAVGDGIIYHKGSFIRVSPQSAIVEKYDTRPTRFLGFETTESTVNSNEDASLLDNATGATNFAAPGAERLKLSPTLTSRIPATANTTTFVTIAKFENGVLVKEQNKTEFSDLGKFIGNISYETNGDFITKPFHFRIREHLKTANNLGRYDSGSTPAGNTNKLVVEIEPGIGYVKGNRTEFAASVFRDVDKATDFATKDARTLSVSYGNYVIVDEVSGHWDVRNLGTVSLRSAAATSVTSRTWGTTSAPGSEIGTAKVRGFEYHSGTSGTADGQYRLYLFDISMNAGQKFASVRSLYYNWGSGPDALADCVLESSEAKLKETNINTLIHAFSQRGTKTLKDAADAVDTQFVVRRSRPITFSGASNRSATLTVGNTATGGTETFNDSVTSAADRKKFLVVAKQAVSTVNLTGTASSSGTTVTGSGTAFTSQLAVGDIIVSDGQTRRVTAIASATSLTTDAAFSGALSGDTFVKHYPSGHIFDFSTDGGSSTNDSSTQKTVHVGGENIATSSWKGEVYFNILRSAAVQEAKTILKSRYVHINLNASPYNNAAGKLGPWSLGVPDVHKIKNVYRGTATGVTTADTNVTREFILNNGQTESFYDTSKLALRPTNQLSTALGASDGLLVEFDHFTTDTSSGKGFFSVDSYPVDDSTVPLPADKIRTQDIPLVAMEGSGSNFDLRDSVDFRPRLANTCSPTTVGTAAGAPTNPASLTSVTVDANFGSYIPTPDENFQADVQYYLNRKDNVLLTADGNLVVQKGVPSERPRAPFDSPEAMTLATLDIPYFPSLSSHVAKQFNRRDLEVKIDVRNNRRYTMKDIRGLDARVDNLEYYASLNALESSAQNKQIFNSTGVNRFKNGIFVDNFDGHNNADTNSRGYRAAIDSSRSQLRPVYRRKDIGMSLSSTLANTAIRKTGDLITLAYSDVEFIDQKKATALRNPVQEITALWNGNIVLNPEIDNTPDVTTLPDIQVDFDGMFDAVSNLTNVLNDEGVLFGDWTTTSSRVTSSRLGGNFSTGVFDIANFTDTIQQTQTLTGTALQVSPSRSTFEIGNFVENVSLRDYMRSREVQFTGTGFKPSTRVYAYFDDEIVSPFCTPTTSAFANTAPQGANLVTDSTGTIYGVFQIPNNDNLKFRVGEREFKIVDVANTQTQSNLITTRGRTTYVSTPLDVVQRGTSVNVTTPVVTGTSVSRTRTNTTTRNRTVLAEREETWDAGEDPLAQTFLVSENSGDGVFLTKLDLFFGAKSSTAPFSVEVREVENGTPTEVRVPYGIVTKQSSAINVNASTPTVTTFTFDTPVFVQNNKEYALVLRPGGDSQDYSVWTASLGDTDVATNETIFKVPAAGVMLTSSNDRTWTPHQKEDLKYKLYRANFTTGTGTFYMENDDIEMLTIDSVSGATRFKAGEKVRGECILQIANTNGGGGVSVGDIVQTGAARFNTTAIANTHYANGVVREIIATTANTTTFRIDAYGNFPISNTGGLSRTNNTNRHANVYIGTTLVGNVNAFTANATAGFVDFYDFDNRKLRLTGSTGGFSNSTYIGYLRGQVSGHSAHIKTTAPDNAVMNMTVPKIPVLQYGNTVANFAIRTATSTISSDFESVDLGEENFLTKDEKKVFSKTNEAALSAVSGSKKTYVVRGTFSSTDPRVSPVLQTSRSNAIVIENVINNLSTDEHKEVGNAQARHVSVPIRLGKDQDAEDLKVYLHAYKPSGTDVKVFAKIKASSDGEALADKDYTPLVQITSSNTVSDSIDTDDIIEFEYGFTANTTTLVGSGNGHAKLLSTDSNIVHYLDTTGGLHKSFDIFAIKIVMTSSGTNVVPLVRDMRALALQV